MDSLRGFSWRPFEAVGLTREGRTSRGVSENASRICRSDLLRAPTAIHQAAASILRVPPSVVTHKLRLGNIDPIPIDYAIRPRLRDRLTLGRRALPRKS